MGQTQVIRSVQGLGWAGLRHIQLEPTLEKHARIDPKNNMGRKCQACAHPFISQLDGAGTGRVGVFY